MDAKTVKDKKGRIWKCFSIFFVCKACFNEGRITKRAIRMQGIKYALIKVGRGLKDFLDRLKKIEINENLEKQTGSAIIEVGQQKVRLKRCPLL